MISVFLKFKFYVFSEENLPGKSQQTATLSSLQITESLTKSIQFHCFKFITGTSSRGGYCYSHKLLDQAGVLVKTRCSSGNGRRKMLSSKACFCLQTGGSALSAMGFTSTHNSAASLSTERQRHLQEDGKISEHRDAHLFFKGPLRECSMLLKDRMPNFQNPPR